MAITRIRGLKEIDAVLKALPPDLVKSALASSLRAGLLPVQNEIQARAPTRDEPGPKRLSKKSGSGRLPGYLRASVARKRGRATSHSMTVGITFRKAWYWFLVEFGGKKVRVDKRGKRSGVMPASPFIRPAIAASADRAFIAFAKALQPAMKRSVDRLARKYGSRRAR